jgi:hypothetical protein
MPTTGFRVGCVQLKGPGDFGKGSVVVEVLVEA